MGKSFPQPFSGYILVCLGFFDHPLSLISARKASVDCSSFRIFLSSFSVPSHLCIVLCKRAPSFTSFPCLGLNYFKLAFFKQDLKSAACIHKVKKFQDKSWAFACLSFSLILWEHTSAAWLQPYWVTSHLGLYCEISLLTIQTLLIRFWP